MLERIKKNNKIQSLVFNKNEDSTYTAYVVKMKYRRGKVEVLDESTYSVESVEEIFQYLDEKLPLILGFSGKGTSLRIIDKNEKDTDEFDLANHIPGFNDEDFFAKWYTTEDDKIMVSVSRRNEIQDIIDSFGEKKYLIPLLSISEISIFLLKEYNILNEREIFTENLVFDFDELTIKKNIEVQEKQYSTNESVGKNLVRSEYLVAFSNGVGYFVDELEGNSDKFEKEQSDVIFQKKIFKNFGLGMLIFFLSILLVNFFIQGQLNAKLVEKESHLVFQSQVLDELNVIEEDINNKYKLIQFSGILNPNGTSYYMNQLSINLPVNIALNQLNIFPLKNKVKPGKLIQIDDKVVVIQGTTKDSESFYQWVEYLSNQSWNSDVNVEIYNTVSEKDIAEFKINIYID